MYGLDFFKCLLNICYIPGTVVHIEDMNGENFEFLDCVGTQSLPAEFKKNSLLSPLSP